jgi:hypothetical protein
VQQHLPSTPHCRDRPPDLGSESLAKSAAARRRISFSVSRRRLSRRSCTSSDCSVAVRPSVTPSSMPAWRHQRFTDSIEIPKSTATSALVRSPRRATVTTSRLNSWGNFLGVTSIRPRGRGPTHRMSTRPAAECRLRAIRTRSAKPLLNQTAVGQCSGGTPWESQPEGSRRFTSHPEQRPAERELRPPVAGLQYKSAVHSVRKPSPAAASSSRSRAAFYRLFFGRATAGSRVRTPLRVARQPFETVAFGAVLTHPAGSE